MINMKEVERIKAKYPAGTRIKMLEDMDDKQPILAGTLGTVCFVDDIGNIHMKWDNGRSLALIEGVDAFEVIV